MRKSHAKYYYESLGSHKEEIANCENIMEKGFTAKAIKKSIHQAIDDWTASILAINQKKPNRRFGIGPNNEMTAILVELLNSQSDAEAENPSLLPYSISCIFISGSKDEDEQKCWKFKEEIPSN